MGITRHSIVLTCILYSVVYQVLGDLIANGPEDATYVRGENAEFSCIFTELLYRGNTEKQVIWAKGDYQTPDFISRDLEIFKDPSKFSVIKDDLIFTLVISNVSPSDRDSYYCAVYTPSLNEYDDFSPSATLNMLTQWPRPECKYEPQQVSPDTQVNFTCSVPPVKVTLPMKWSSPKNKEFGGSKMVQPGGSYSITWEMKEMDNFRNFSCYAGRENGHGEPCIESPIHIKPELTVEPSTCKKSEGNKADFECVTNIAYPNVTMYTWVVKNQDGVKEYTKASTRFRFKNDGKIFRIKNLTIDDDKMEVWCKTRHDLAITSEAINRGIILVNNDSLPVEVPVDPEKETIDDTSTGIIIGGTIAGIILLIIIILLTIYLIKGNHYTNFKIRLSKTTGVSSNASNRQRNAEAKDVSVSINDDVVLYALPSQKGGGTMKVKKSKDNLSLTAETQNSVDSALATPRRNSTSPVGLNAAELVKSLNSSQIPSKSMTALDSLETGHEYVMYTLPLQKGGGKMRIRSRNTSKESLDNLSRTNSSEMNLASDINQHESATSEYADIGSFALNASEYEPVNNPVKEMSEYADVKNLSITTDEYDEVKNLKSEIIEYADVKHPGELFTYDDIKNPESITSIYADIKSPVSKTDSYADTIEQERKPSEYAHQINPVNEISTYSDVKNPVSEISPYSDIQMTQTEMSPYEEVKSENVTQTYADASYQDMGESCKIDTADDAYECMINGTSISDLTAICKTDSNGANKNEANQNMEIKKEDEPYMNMSGTLSRKTRTKSSESDYVQADFPPSRQNSMESLISIDSPEPPRQLNSDGLLNASVEISSASEEPDICIIDDYSANEYADIKDMTQYY